jgi:hypothetical protein
MIFSLISSYNGARNNAFSDRLQVQKDSVEELCLALES